MINFEINSATKNAKLNATNDLVLFTPVVIVNARYIRIITQKITGIVSNIITIKPFDSKITKGLRNISCTAGGEAINPAIEIKINGALDNVIVPSISTNRKPLATIKPARYINNTRLTISITMQIKDLLIVSSFSKCTSIIPSNTTPENEPITAVKAAIISPITNASIPAMRLNG